jgi:hypothetical protein
MRSISSPFLAALDRELELALQEIDAGSSAVGPSDVTAMAVTVLQEATAVVDIRGLDEAMKAIASIDLPALEEAVALFGPYAGLQSKVPTSDGTPITLADRLEKMKKRVTQLKTVGNPLGIDLSMGFLGMAMTVSLAILHENAKPIPSKLRDLLRKKLGSIPETNLWNVWRQVQQEFVVDEDYAYYDRADPEIPSEFFTAPDAAAVRARLVAFLIDVKPKLFVSRSKKGIKESPAIAPPLPAFLGVADAAILRPGRQKEHLMVGLSQTLSLWEDDSRQTLVDALEINAAGWVAKDSKERFVALSKGAVGSALGVSHQLRALRRVLGYIDAFAEMGNPVESLLTSYKLSREVLADRFRKEISDQKKVSVRRLA